MQGLTQRDLAERLEIDPQTVSRMERDDERVAVENVARAASHLALDFDWSTRTIKPPTDLPPEAFARPKRHFGRWMKDLRARAAVSEQDWAAALHLSPAQVFGERWLK